MHNVTAIIGGSVGNDPYASNTWSGSAAHLFRAMEAGDLLDGRAHGIDISKPLRMLLLAKNFSQDRNVWRRHFFFDPNYRAALSRAAAQVPVNTPFSFQLGAMYSLPQAHPQKRAISFHDGNLAELEAAGFGLDGVAPKRIEQALRYEVDVAQQVTAIFTMSEYLRQSFIKNYGVPAKKVVNVGGAFNLKEIPAEQMGKSYTAPRLLFIGIDFFRKGGEVLLQGFEAVLRRFPTAELHIVGPRELESIPPGVVFHGHLSKEEPAGQAKLEELFRSASLFVLPSLYEPFGIAPLEAMLYQLPCVVTRGWALQETVVEGVTGELVEKGNAEELAEKICGLLREPERMAAMGLAGRERARTEYTWEAVVGRMKAGVGRL